MCSVDFLTAQISYPTKGDWLSEVLMYMEELDLDISLSDIGSMTKKKFNLFWKETWNIMLLIIYWKERFKKL